MSSSTLRGGSPLPVLRIPSLLLLAPLVGAVLACASSARPRAPASEKGSVIQVANEDLVPGKLAVKVFAHRISITDVRCWTYATAGLWALGQRELLVSVKQEPGETDAAFPRELFGFFRFVHKAAAQKRLVDQGDVTLLSEGSPPLLAASRARSRSRTASPCCFTRRSSNA